MKHGGKMSSNAILVYPETKVLRSGKAKCLGVALIGGVFTLVGWWMIRDGHPMGWFVLLFFFLMFCVSLANCLPRASGMVVMPEGFAVRSLFRAWYCSWQDVEEFGVFSAGGTKMVGFRIKDVSQYKGARLSDALCGCHGVLPETFGLSAESLAMAMNGYREAAVRATDGSS